MLAPPSSSRVLGDLELAETAEDVPMPEFVAENRADNTAGNINLARVKLHPRQPVSGSGLLASITLQRVDDNSRRDSVLPGWVLQKPA